MGQPVSASALSEPEYVVSVDVARGYCALCVMLYHTLSYEGIAQVDAVAFYAVYAFFVISGFSLWISYADKLTTAPEVRNYVLRRYFRLAPLFWLAVVLHGLIASFPQNWQLALPANLTMLLGFYNPGATSIITGGWSLGIEFVFYLVFPVVVAMGKSSRLLVALTLSALIMQFLFINYLLTSHGTFTSALWSAYTQPVSFAGYFFAGCLIGEIFRSSTLRNSRVAMGVALAAMLFFSLIPSPNTIGYLTGWRGLALASLTIVFVAAIAFCPQPRGRFRTFSIWVGVLSYPVYLLHPLVYLQLTKWGVAKGWWGVALVVALTILLSHFISKYYEIPLKLWGRSFEGPKAVTVEAR